MSRKRAIIGFGLVSMLALGVAGFLGFRGATSEDVSAAPAAAPTTMLSYAVKFVCGQQPLLNASTQPVEPPVKPGNYATEINIHNPQYLIGDAPANLKISKKLVILVGSRQVAGANPQPFAFREPELAKPSRFVSFQMPPDTATMDDCQQIWKMAAQVGMPLAPNALTIGYLVVMAPKEIDVDAVYTSAVPGSLTEKSTGIAIDVERITPKRVAVPDTVIKP